jgi:putative CocE/NonD family hydrolase
VPAAAATAWYLGADGELSVDPPTAGAGATGTVTSYRSDPTAVPPTFYEGDSTTIWRADVAFDWREPPADTVASWSSAPLESDTVVVGSGSMDLWLGSSSPDTDLEVTVSELRPDGTEVYVQSGWLRASQRALDDEASTELHPVHTHLEADSAPLPDGELTPVRVALFPFAHAFRAGSRLRVTVDAPGGNRPVWVFDTIAAGETNEVAHDREHPSRLVLPVVPGITVPPGAPACGSLRGQPCRSPG